MKPIDEPDDFTVVEAHLAFVLPFAYQKKNLSRVTASLERDGYRFFSLDDRDSMSGIYPEGVKVMREELDQYFLPYVEQKLFPESAHDYGFKRFSKPVGEEFVLEVKDRSYPFRIISVDIVLAPFGIAFMTTRVELLTGPLPLSSVLDFNQHFRAAENKLKEEKGTAIRCPDGKGYENIHDFLLGRQAVAIKPYVIHDERLTGYFGSLPYFEDERMYVHAFYFTEPDADVADEQLFRVGRVDGLDSKGKRFISTTNGRYVEEYLDKYLHDRWAPGYYLLTTDYSFAAVSTKPREEMERPLAHFMSTHYYNFLIHYFYRIMLLRVSFEYSRLKWDKDEEYLKRLIQLITIFSSWYYFEHISARQEGRELGKKFREAFNIEVLYREVKDTLDELYRVQENSATSRMNLLLFFLTVFTVISGIYGMNLVIDDWKDDISWKEIESYGFFEWISLLTAVIGISMSIYLFITTLGRTLWRKLRMRWDDMDL
ncbi:magnesium transporter CorA family protein [Edaphobacillus lindanitolerans]|uniref:CorA-like Mg2+ transporter protein n=1 Tax=Edaphobacillus lindanitolerans TaxID=550447 RepID=A0A1U7PIU3_9BACI|nr:hypothetical protein [Edaphobacillus lindanitolerans]SIT68271.1 hypothetical protein SAMN05428946_0346 [Edaphobacillus lindanitolerans]